MFLKKKKKTREKRLPLYALTLCQARGCQKHLSDEEEEEEEVEEEEEEEEEEEDFLSA